MEVEALGQLLPAQAATLLKAPEGPIPPAPSNTWRLSVPLLPSHTSRAIPHRPSLRVGDVSARGALAEFRSAITRDPAGKAFGASRLETFVERHLELRDDLAWRAAQGERLTETDRATLDAFDAVLDQLLPAPAPLPDDVRQIIRDVKRAR